MNIRRLGISFFYLVTSLAFPCYGQQMESSSVQILVRQLEDPEGRIRSDVFYRLLELGRANLEPPRALSRLLEKWPEQSDEIKLALFKLLERENEVTKERETVVLEQFRKKGPDVPHPFPDAEERTEYYADLVWTVVSLKDQRCINALIGAIQTGNMVMRTLAEFGTAALDPVIQQLNSSDVLQRSASARVLLLMLEPNSFQKVSDSVSRQKIKQALITAARDESHYVRLKGIDGLAKLGDADMIPLIQKIAIDDPYEGAEFVAAERGTYPVREAARQALKKLK
ncbi:MAG: HEAT repeat domain-containing protein [Candidatus Binatia bacterium]